MTAAAPDTASASTPARAVIGIVFNRHGHLLLGRKIVKPGHPFSDQWHLPGGKVEPGETDEQALVREMSEEAGIQVTILARAAQTEASDGGTWTWFNCATSATDATAGDDLSEARFVPPYEVADMVEDNVTEHWPHDLRVVTFGFAGPETRQWTRLTEALLAKVNESSTGDVDEDAIVRTLDEIDDLLEGVSPGPWEFWPGTHGDPLVAQVGHGAFGAITMCSTSPPGDDGDWLNGSGDYGRANAIFIAATRTVVPQLTDMVRDRDRQIAELTDANHCLATLCRQMIEAHDHVVMDSDADKELHARAIAIFSTSLAALTGEQADVVADAGVEPEHDAGTDDDEADYAERMLTARQRVLDANSVGMSDTEKHLLSGHGLRYHFDATGPCSDNPEAIPRMAHWDPAQSDHKHLGGGGSRA